MTDKRCKHGVYISHRCRDCEHEESNDPLFQRDAKIFQLENELQQALEHVNELEKESRFLKRCIVTHVQEVERDKDYTSEQALEVFTQGRT